MAMLDPVIDGWLASRRGAPALGNAIFTTIGTQFRRPPVQPEELRRSWSGRGMHCVQSQ